MDDSSDYLLEKIIGEIEFPGEDREKILDYLNSKSFVDHVMAEAQSMNSRSKKTALWGLFALLNLFLLFIMGTNNYIVSDFFALQDALSQFFFLFLGLTLVGSLIGLIFSLNTSWFDNMLHRDSKENQDIELKV